MMFASKPRKLDQNTPFAMDSLSRLLVVESEDEEVAPESVHDSEEEADLPPRITRRGREVKRPRRLEE